MFLKIGCSLWKAAAFVWSLERPSRRLKKKRLALLYKKI
jgi:hypothetical protein